jgi:hypothetical protein
MVSCARQQYVYNVEFPLSDNESTTSDVEAEKPINLPHTPRITKDIPASPSRLASKVSSQAKTDRSFNFVDIEKQKQCHIPVKATGTMPFQIKIGTLSCRAPSQCSAVTSLQIIQNNVDGIAYQVGHVQCVDPIYNSGIHNIIDMGPSRVPLISRTTIDPCWTLQARVLLVEDDKTCKHIGSFLLKSLQCQINAESGRYFFDSLCPAG